MPTQIDDKYQFVYLKKIIIPLFSLEKNVVLTSPNNKIESEMTYNTTATLDKLVCTDYVFFGKCQDRFGRISWSKNSFDYMDVKLKVFKKDENQHFRLAQNFTMGEADLFSFFSTEESAGCCGQ